MLTKQRIAELRKGRGCLVPKPNAKEHFITSHEYKDRLCDCQVLELLNAIETLTQAIRAVECESDLHHLAVTNCFGCRLLSVTEAALAKVYGEEVSDGKMMDMAAKQARGET